MTESLMDRMDPGWRVALAPVAGQIAQMADFLREEDSAGRGYLPPARQVLRPFERPMDEVRVLIVGQDPYPTPGHSVGLSFSVAPGVRPLPRSLVNIYREYQDDLGYPQPGHGDLSSWADAGVLLLNRVLSVRPGDTGSHRRKGWEAVTEQAIRSLVARRQPLVAILWGRDAQSLTPMLGDIGIVSSSHPSPLSASRGFFGSRPFTRANELLMAADGQPVDWRLPAEVAWQSGLWQ